MTLMNVWFVCDIFRQRELCTHTTEYTCVYTSNLQYKYVQQLKNTQTTVTNTQALLSGIQLYLLTDKQGSPPF